MSRPRKNPILLRRGPLSGRVNAITNYTRKGDLVKAIDQYDVSNDFRALMLETLMPPGNEGLQPLVVKAARGEKLTEAESEQLGDFADRLGAEITAHEESKGSAS